jgi:hypothetical protein
VWIWVMMLLIMSKGMVSICFRIPSGGVLDLSDVLFVLGLKKNLLLVPSMENHYWKDNIALSVIVV